MFPCARVARFCLSRYVKLGKLLDDDTLRALQQRIDAIMLGQAKGAARQAGA